MKRNIDVEAFKRICRESHSMSEACIKLNMAFTTFKYYAKRFDCYFPNQGKRGYTKPNSLYWTKEKLLECLEHNLVSFQSGKLKKLLYKFSIKEAKCEHCGLSIMWNDKPIELELHHKNGIRVDNRLDNLEILCPNCHSQTLTHRAKNKRIGAADKKLSVTEYRKLLEYP